MAFPKLLAPLVVLAGTLAAVICLDDAPPAADLVLVNSNEVFTLDPQRMTWTQDFRAAYALYEGLARWDNRTFDVEPGAATWSAGDDGLTWRFSIRHDARWSNGDPVTAQDFIYSWQRAMLPDSAAGYSALFRVIAGAEDFFRWRADALAEFAAGARDLDEPARRARAMDLWDETQRRFQSTVGLAAAGDRTLEVTLARPAAYFLDLVAFAPFLPVHRPTVEGWQVDDGTRARMRRDGWAAVGAPPWADRRFVRINPDTGRLQQQHGWTKPPLFVGNGPYALRQWRYRRGLLLEANPGYHGPQPAASRTISIVSIEDVNTAVLAFESGRIDWLSDVSSEYQADMLAQRDAYVSRYAGAINAARAEGRSMDETLAALPPPRAGERRNIHLFPTFGTDFYGFNCRPQLPDGADNPLADARVRRAFVMSVDKHAIVERVTRLNEPVATTLVPPGSIPGYHSPTGLGYDPKRARDELAAAGWADRDGDGIPENAGGRPFPVVELLYSTNTPRYRDISLALRDMWQRQLGVRVELRGKESKFLREDLKSGHFMIGRGGWFGDYGDPTTFLDICRTGDGNNTRGYSSSYVDSLLERADREPDPEARLRLLEECERFLVQEDVPLLVLCQYVQLYMYEPGRLTGLSRHLRLVQYLGQLQVHDR